ncbi:MAG: TetR/AcrR family transcriptional regulator [Candidatus Cloacimonetes bacterium]|nr:TetR/AcrR family transcriptional regulator [Candidatus Cloacimonadota bacterium]
MEQKQARSPKETQLMATAEELFLRCGIRRVTVEEICRKAHVSKMTYYKYFSSKADIAVKVLEKICSEMSEIKWGILRADKPFTWKAEQLIELEVDLAKRMSEDFLYDYFNYPELKPLVTKIMKQGYSDLEELYREAQRKGEIRQDISLKLIMYMTRQLYVIMQDEAILSEYDNMRDFTRELARFYFYGLLGHNDDEKDA